MSTEYRKVAEMTFEEAKELRSRDEVISGVNERLAYALEEYQRLERIRFLLVSEVRSCQRAILIEHGLSLDDEYFFDNDEGTISSLGPTVVVPEVRPDERREKRAAAPN